jgi:hypothetical protein
VTAGARVPTGRGPTLLRHLAGFAVAPLVTPLVLGAIDAARGARTWMLEEALRSALAVAVRWFLPLGYAAALLLGVPVVLALAAARRLNVAWVVGASSAVAATAIAAGVLVAGVVDDHPIPFEDLPLLALVAGAGALLAAAVSGAYCAVAGVPLGRRLSRAPPA